VSIVLIKEISIDENIVITVALEIQRASSQGEINMVVLIAVPFWLISGNDDGVALLDVLFDPLEVVFVLRL
jgi:hypothetical protein